MHKIIVKASDLDGYLTDEDLKRLGELQHQYEKLIELFGKIDKSADADSPVNRELISYYQKIGDFMKWIIKEEDRITVNPFIFPEEIHGEVSRLISKLRDIKTGHFEFVYYVQRAYEILFNMAFASNDLLKKNYLITKTPVNNPVQNYAVHKIPDIDFDIKNTVMCVMLRGALLPSMIVSKEIQEYSSKGYITPFAFFRIKRDDSKQENNMEYILDLEKSYFDLEKLNGKKLIFADPMNATGGSLVTIIKYLNSKNIKPESIIFLNIISALKGSLRIVRALDNVNIYTLWMDPVLNEDAYILPGLGDAGDRLNGKDLDDSPRNLIQLIADYGSNITELYRAQVREIENTILG